MKTSSRISSFAARLAPHLVFSGGILLVLFWLLYFCGLITPGEDNKTVASAFESAFPPADTLLGLSLMLAGIGLIKQRAFGTFFLVAAGAMALFLGTLDLSFCLQQGLYMPITASSLFLLFVNVICVCGGTVGLWLGWKLWRTNHVITTIAAEPGGNHNGCRQRHRRRHGTTVGASGCQTGAGRH